MPNRTSSGLLLPVIIVVGLVAVFGGSRVIDAISGIVGGNDPIIVGEGDSKLMVASDAESKVKQCTAAVILTTKQCGDTKVIVVDAGKMPFISHNISAAWGEGKAFLLHRDTPQSRRAKYEATCGKFVRSHPRGSCDEYPFASSQEGGAGARTQEVPDREQNCQGGTLSRAYDLQKINIGDEYLVVISNPDKITTQPYAGVDIAKDPSCAS